MLKIILDTDIGSDVDDALALALLLGSDSLDFLGITTVYGDTKLRAQIAMHLCSTANRSIPTFAGNQQTLSGSPVWTTGKEGAAMSNLDGYSIQSKNAVDFLIDTVNELPGQVQIIAIGPLTNIATAIIKSDQFVKNLGHLWIMGGNFTGTKIEHNFKCDVASVQNVLNSSIPMTILDLPSSQKTIINMPEINQIKQSGLLGPILFNEIIGWITPRNQDWTIPHDPVAALAVLYPELFDISDSGIATVDNDGSCRWKPDARGTVQLISPKESQKVVEVMIELIAKVS